MSNERFFASLAEQLNCGATRAALGLLSFRNDSLREHLRSIFEKFLGTGHSFLGDPVFEATFGWCPAPKTLGDLAGNLLQPSLVEALSKPPKVLAEEYAFPVKQHPYLHQLLTWQALIAETPPRSVLVSSGTGSGKTECFLVPILNDLASELAIHPAPLVGVRALFLYPLNALIKSQRDRLTAWSEPFNGGIRYCLYNGDTPKEGRRSDWKCEVADRRTLRNNPPPVLVTNATMLEYMLVRTEDQPILAQSQGKLRWIVIDEAHTYIGSQAAELTLLLRRVLHAFGCRSEDVHFVATSATIAGDGDKTKEELRDFLADIAGVSTDQISVVEGSRLLPDLPKVSSAGKSAKINFETLRRSSPEERFAMLVADPAMRRLRLALAQHAHTLSSLTEMLFQGKSAKAVHRALEMLDLCTGAQDVAKDVFLPLRGHFFQRTLNGIWACANPTCKGRDGTHLDKATWPFGKVFLERYTQCDACGFPVFEMVQCGECGAEHLSVLELSDQGNNRLNPNVFVLDEDEFQQELEPLEAEEGEEEEARSEPLGPGLPRLLVTPPHGNQVGLMSDGKLDWYAEAGIAVHLLGPGEDDSIRCPCCHAHNQRGQLFRPVRLSAPFLLQTAIPILLRHLPPMQSKEALPFDGRRLLSFTDSRQGTARIAVKLQIETERDYVRSLLCHAIADRARTANLTEIEAQQKQIEALGAVVASNPALSGLLEQQRQKLAVLQAPPLGRMTWSEAQNYLLSDDGFKHWLLPPLREQTFGLNDRQLADLCLWREFFKRPRRQWSLETFGLLRLGYPGIERIGQVPAVAAQLQISLNDWRALAQIAFDFLIRQNLSVAIPDDLRRWLGYPGKPTLAIGPSQEKVLPHQRPWPSAQSFARKRMRLVRLLAHAFKKDVDQQEDRELIDELLVALWNNVQGLLSATENGYKLEMEQQVEIVQVREAWLCPVTRRLLPVTFRGITPYLPENPTKELTECKKLTMPLLPHPFWLESSPGAADEWLEFDDRVNELRTLGVWTNLNDRIARFARYFRSTEHSAQLAGATLTLRERDFKAGKINLLSCSTTMEMGVDIGGLTAVAMHNAPPNPANFLQRAGRAGRRGESVSLSFTLCKSTPHGEAVFHNPLWPFTTPLAVPKVALSSALIVQRHINALTLATFLCRHTTENLRRLNTGGFFEAPQETDRSASWEQFVAWCESGAVKDTSLVQGMKMLLSRSGMEGRNMSNLLNSTTEKIGLCARGWLDELQALLDNLAIVQTEEGDTAAERAVNFQLTRLRREYLLSELSTRGFLPGYGFPGGVVPLVTTTAEELSRPKVRLEAEAREDNRAMRAGYPTRNLAIAIRDYSPGTDTVLNGRVYRSSGITLNWHIPADQEGSPEIQAFRWLWRCDVCGSTGTKPAMQFSCPRCSEQDAQKIRWYEYLEPAGFAVDIRWHPHNDINAPQYIPVRDPLIDMSGTEWAALPSSSLGRYRHSNDATIINRSDGLHGNGYAICLRCGRADSMMTNDELPLIFHDTQGNIIPHKRLRGGKNNDRETECPGSHEEWAIKRNVRLVATTRTDIFELQLHDQKGNPIDRITAYSLGVGLRRALADMLGVEEREIGIATSPTRDRANRSAHSIYLFDTAQGGAGYVSKTIEKLPSLLRMAKTFLHCPKDCDVACQACLLSYDTQHHIQYLDRRNALQLLDEQFFLGLEVPKEMQVFGPGTRFEMEPLILALRRERQRIGASEIRVFLGGKASEWEPLAWRLRSDLLSLHEVGLRICFVVPRNCLETLQPSQREDLAALAVITEAEVFVPKTTPVLTGNGVTFPRILEIGDDKRSICWAASIQDALAPSAAWGNNSEDVHFFREEKQGTLAAIPEKWERASQAILVDKRENTFAITITNELDGPLQGFGERAWRLLMKSVPVLKAKMTGDQPLTAISYSDRYLRSPLTLLLLKELLAALKGYPCGVGVPAISVLTSKLEGWKDLREAQFLHHDWRDADHRQQAFSALFASVGQFTLQEKANFDVPHARELRLCWQDGSEYIIRFDQGVGYWKISRGVKSYPFDFTIEKQFDYLKSLELDIEASSRNHPTLWYVSGCHLPFPLS